MDTRLRVAKVPLPAGTERDARARSYSDGGNKGAVVCEWWWIVPSARVFGAVAASFVVGALAGAGSLWLVHDREQTASPATSQEPAPANTPAFVPPQAITYDPDKVTIEYQIVTDGMSVTHLSYVDVVDGAPVMVESLGTPPPFAHVIQLPKSEDFDLRALSVTGMGAATSTTTTCTLRIDGKAIARQTATGTYGLVNCEVPTAEGPD